MERSDLHLRLNDGRSFVPIPSVKTSLQFKALFYRSIANQKRQLFTNVCCVGLCPLVIVIISALLGTIVYHTYQMTPLGKPILYCSSLNATNAFGFPMPLNDTNCPITYDVPGAIDTPVTHLNLFMLHPQKWDFDGRKENEFFTPCIHSFGQSSDPNAAYSLDSIYLPFPNSSVGWINALLSMNVSDQKESWHYYRNMQMRPWILYSGTPEALLQLGQRPQKPPITNLTFNTSIYPVTFQDKNNNVSFLNTIEKRYWAQLNSNELTEFEEFPYFTKVNNSHFDETITKKLKITIDMLSTMNKSVLFQNSPSKADVIDFYDAVEDIIRNIPYGSVWFELIDVKNMVFNYTLQFGSDFRLRAAPSFPGKGKRLFLQQSQLSNAILRYSNPKKLGNFVISQGTRIFPQLSENQEPHISGWFGKKLFPFALSFLLPIFVVTLVNEKESKQLIMMQMNGVKTSTYLLSHYLTFYIIYSISSISFLVTGIISEMALFTKTSTYFLMSILSLWGQILITMSFVFSVFFSRSSKALRNFTFILIKNVLASISIDNNIEQIPYFIVYIWPPLTFYRVLSLINTASFSHDRIPYSWNNIQTDDEVYQCIIVMYIQITLLFSFAGYLSYVVPTEHGIPKPWHYAISRVFRQITGIRKQRKSFETIEAELENLELLKCKREDQSIMIERSKVMNLDHENDYPLVIKNVCKSYNTKSGKRKVAIENVTFAIEKDTVFGLLGTNGGGKTSLIGILTGLIEATSGTAWVGGYDVQTETKYVHKQIGVCPQFDVLMPTLTVKDTLLFYGRLKGIISKEEKSVIKECLSTVKLEGFGDRLTSTLSSSEKRRLSIAIALIGDPKVIILDEPTAGLDPLMKREIWDIIGNMRKGKSIIMTTHSMEEAEVCCQRIGIMMEGSLVTIGTINELREKYGKGFHLSLEINPDKKVYATEFLKSIFPKTEIQFQNKKGYNSDLLVCNLECDSSTMADIFQMLIVHSFRYGILNWKMGEKHLEEIFNIIVAEDPTE